MKEIEIKVRVENVAPLREFLQNSGTLLFTDKQVDDYYTPAHKNYVAVMPIEEWLRLRDSKGKFSLNYKRWRHDAEGKSDYCDEHETGVESLDKAREILMRIDCKHLITVNKIRSAWKYQDYEIAFDEVEGLGSFVEIEWKGSEQGADPKEIANSMMKFLESLSVGKIERSFKGYPHQLLEQAGLLPKVYNII